MPAGPQFAHQRGAGHPGARPDQGQGARHLEIRGLGEQLARGHVHRVAGSIAGGQLAAGEATGGPAQGFADDASALSAYRLADGAAHLGAGIAARHADDRGFTEGRQAAQPLRHEGAGGPGAQRQKRAADHQVFGRRVGPVRHLAVDGHVGAGLAADEDVVRAVHDGPVALQLVGDAGGGLAVDEDRLAALGDMLVGRPVAGTGGRVLDGAGGRLVVDQHVVGAVG
ncbi:hypothetical protein AZA_28868 [Nitrospirillum viridazoti Y2]|nr:hypothetical protein AZA_28868 [Nitrospirillum amazonense Y2]